MGQAKHGRLTRKQLINSLEYNLTQVQINIYYGVLVYQLEKGLSFEKLAKRLNLSLDDTMTIMAGDCDLPLSKLAAVAHKVGMAIYVKKREK